MNKTLNTMINKAAIGDRIMAKGVTVSNDSYATGLNNHDLIIGGSGSGKTTGYVCPNIRKAKGSIVVCDTKRQLYKQHSSYLKSHGFKTICFDFVAPKSSMGYNPLDYIRRDDKGRLMESDIKKISTLLVPPLDKNEPFWEKAATRYIAMLIGYVMEALPEEEQTMMSVVKLHQEYIGGSGAELIKNWANSNPDSYAARKYKMLFGTSSADKTWASILEFANEALDVFDCKEYQYIFDTDYKMNLRGIARRKMAVFVNVSDNDTSYHILANIFMAQLLQVLMEEADNNPDGRLSIPVRLFLDDFASAARIENFDKTISVLRSREISVSVMLQSISQIKSMYGDNDAVTIMNNCDHILYLGGGNDLETADFIAEHINKTRNTVLTLEQDKAILITRGQPSQIVDKLKPVDPETGLYKNIIKNEKELS